MSLLSPEHALAFVEKANATIADAVAKRDATPPEQRVTVIIPAGGRAPQTQPPIAPRSGAPEIPAPAAPAAPAAAATARELSDAEILNKVGTFLDPTQMGPLFVSTPIRRRIFFGKYPSFAETLSAENVLGVQGEGASADIKIVWNIASNLGVAIVGYLFVHDPAIELILANPATPARWPNLRPFSIANNRDPHLMSDVIELGNQYGAWKVAVTPTEDELEKFYSLTG